MSAERIDADYDYRLSHQGRGKGYVDFFEKSPRLRILWDIEKQMLVDVLAMDRFQGKAIRYLDFACGTGRVAGHVEDKVAEAVGVDVSETMLAIARDHVKSTRLIHRDITQDGLEHEGRFDLITAFRFFANAQPELRLDVIRALSSLLADKGVLVFNNHRRAESLNERSRAWLSHIYRPSKYSRTMTDSEVDQILDAGGLRVVKRRHLGVIPSKHLSLPMPGRLFRRAEQYLAHCAWAARFANYHLYVCERTPGS
jgi:predicted TPR repeat methyltransferase